MAEKHTHQSSIDDGSSGKGTNWERLRSMSDEEANARATADPDAPPTDKAFWESARVVMPPGKTKISLYVDNDVLSWFKGAGKGYQTRINAILRSYMVSHAQPTDG